jgi:WD40 repeat protein
MMLGLRLVFMLLASFFAAIAAWAEEAAPQEKYPAEIVPQVGHSGRITSVVFSPDSRFALSGSEDHTLILWDVGTGKELRSFAGHTDEVFAVAFAPDGRFALSGSKDKSLKLWDVATGKVVRSFSGHDGGVLSAGFSPDGRLALSGSSKTLKLWDVATGNELRSFAGEIGDARAVAFSPDGRFALSSDADITLWDVATGEALRRFKGAYASSVAFSPDGRFILSNGGSDVKLWEVATGKELQSFGGHSNDPVRAVAFSPDGRFVLAGGDLKVWELVTGRELRRMGGYTGRDDQLAFSPDGRFALYASGNALTLREVANGKTLRRFTGHATAFNSAVFSPDGRFVLSGGCEETDAHSSCTKGSLKLWEAATGRKLQSFSGHTNWVNSVTFSPDGRFALSGSDDKTLKLWAVRTGKELRSFRGHTSEVFSVAFSPDGRFALSGSEDTTLKLWNIAAGKELRSFRGHIGGITSVAFSPDGRFALSGTDLRDFHETMKLWDVATGKVVHNFGGDTYGITSLAFAADGRIVTGNHVRLKVWKGMTGPELPIFNEKIGDSNSAVFSPDGRLILSADGHNQLLRLWDAATGTELRSFSGHTGEIKSAAFSRNGELVLSAAWDGTIRIWNAENSHELGRMFAAEGDGWLAFTPDGFFSASHRDTDVLAIVRGTEATTIGQVHQSLFNPDLVREALAGDPGGEVRRAAEVINLDKVLDSGPAPSVAITSHPPGSQSGTSLVTVAARITDRGKGIGRVEWRLNGITAGVTQVPTGNERDHEVKLDLALDPGENKIEVIAYNARNLLASVPARTVIQFAGPADTVKPKLYILAIGINAYSDKGWTPPGSSSPVFFPPLSLAVADAKALAAEMQKAGAGMYSEVRVTEALDADATAAGLEQAIARVATGIAARDTFILFAAAHGISAGGRFYLIPQDYQGGDNPDSLARLAIGQDRLQDWVANRIKAKKVLILLDTCESGALVSGYTKSRTDSPASEAAVGRLHEATGRPVLTAAASGKPAFEGHNGHGVFTFAVMDALHKGDSNGNGIIELSELVSHVQELVPKLAGKLNGRSVTAVAARGFTDDEQSARFGSTGEDFAIARRLP